MLSRVVVRSRSCSRSSRWCHRSGHRCRRPPGSACPRRRSAPRYQAVIGVAPLNIVFKRAFLPSLVTVLGNRSGRSSCRRGSARPRSGRADGDALRCHAHGPRSKRRLLNFHGCPLVSSQEKKRAARRRPGICPTDWPGIREPKCPGATRAAVRWRWNGPSAGPCPRPRPSR